MTNNSHFFRYHFFTVWPNGFDKLKNIIEIIEEEQEIEIIQTKSHIFNNMRHFVYKLYACDSVPLQHLESKLRYLYNLEPKVINIFVKNFNPQEFISGKFSFRKRQCKTIVSIKNKIRNLYNPKHPNPNFQLQPLDKGISHEHVVHASDNEGQVDYYLKLLGIKSGIDYFSTGNENPFFEKPFHINVPSSYSMQYITLDKLKANIRVSTKRRNAHKKVQINETPHFKGLDDNMEIYREYLENFQFNFLGDNYSVEKFSKLAKLSDKEIDQMPPIIVKQIDGYFLILDGLHRAAINLYKNKKYIKGIIFQ